MKRFVYGTMALMNLMAIYRKLTRRRRKPCALFALDDPVLDNPLRVDEALEGFGE